MGARGRSGRGWGSLWTCTKCTSTPSSRWSPASSERYPLHSHPSGARVLPGRVRPPAVCARTLASRSCPLSPPPFSLVPASPTPLVYSCPLFSPLVPSPSSSPLLSSPLSTLVHSSRPSFSSYCRRLFHFRSSPLHLRKSEPPIPSSICGFISWMCWARVEVQFPRRLPPLAEGKAPCVASRGLWGDLQETHVLEPC